MHPFARTLLSVLFLALSLAGAGLPAQAQETLYTVPNVHVDANAASATEALNAGINQGRPKAFQILFRRLTRQQDWARQPALDSGALLRLSRGYTIANEKRSTTRYVADVTYIFNPDAVARLLRANNIAFAQGAAKRALLIPMSPGVGHGPWASALMSPTLQGSVVPYSVLAPEDDAALAGLNFESATWNDVAAVAAKNRTTEVALVQAVYGNGRMTVNVRRLGQGEAPARGSVEVPVQGTMGTAYPVAAQAALRAIEDVWKSRSVVDYSQRGRLTVDVRITSLAQWGGLQSQLGTISNISSVNVAAMHMGYARIVIGYVGALEQLREALSGVGLALTSRGGQWTLAPAAPGNP